MKNEFSVPRGTSDILPDEVHFWQEFESKARSLLKIYGYKEIRTPYFERTELFARSMGQTSDIVQKQMLSLASQKQTKENDFKAGGLSLRPEGTAAVVRSYITNRFDKKESLSKLYYIGPMFRGERPQKGRLRQFQQIGAEAIGPDSRSPYLDAEMIALSVHILEDLGVKVEKNDLAINTLGSAKDKESFSIILRKQLQSKKASLCEDCQKRFERNVFRVLDCKKKPCKAVVKKLSIGHDHLSAESQTYFAEVKDALDCLNIPYTSVPSLVRGLDYYTHTVFEISNSSLGSQDALGAGGRYNNLVKQLGGPEVDAVGFALGMERVLLAASGHKEKIASALNVFIISLDTNFTKNAFALLQRLRHAGVSGDMSHRSGSMKSLMRAADKSGAKHVIILGEEEVNKGTFTVKNMKFGEQVKLSDFDRLVNQVSEKGQ